MTQTFRFYLSDQLDRMLQEHRVVVFNDPREEFKAFLDEQDVVDTGLGELQSIRLGDTLIRLTRNLIESRPSPRCFAKITARFLVLPMLQAVTQGGAPPRVRRV